MTATARDKVKVINGALMLHLGMPPMFAADSQDQMAQACLAAYEQVLAEVFALTDWSFSRTTRQLDRLAEVPENGFKHVFLLPSEAHGMPTRFFDDPKRTDSVLRHYALEQGRVYADCGRLYCRYSAAVDPEYWPPAFADAFSTALAAKLAVACQQNTQLADIKTQEAYGSPQQGGTGGKFGRLLAQDKAAEPMSASLYWNDPLTEARFNGVSPSASRWRGF